MSQRENSHAISWGWFFACAVILGLLFFL